MANGPTDNGWKAEKELYRKQVEQGFDEIHYRMDKFDAQAEERYERLTNAYHQLHLAFTASQAAYKAEVRLRAILWGAGSGIGVSIIAGLVLNWLTGSS